MLACNCKSLSVPPLLSPVLFSSRISFELSLLVPSAANKQKRIVLVCSTSSRAAIVWSSRGQRLEEFGGGRGEEQHTKEHSTKIFDKMVEFKSMLLSSDVYFFYWYVTKLSIKTLFSCLKIRHLWWAALISLYFPLSVLPLIKPVLVPDIFWRLLFRSPGLPSIADVVRPMLPSQKGI